jgi:hypothetical protein
LALETLNLTFKPEDFLKKVKIFPSELLIHFKVVSVLFNRLMNPKPYLFCAIVYFGDPHSAFWFS